ncbi:MAG: ABC transporter substrate-binding protein [Lautropia sp.]
MTGRKSLRRVQILGFAAMLTVGYAVPCAFAKDVLRVGALLPLSAPGDVETGKKLLRTIELFAEEWNKNASFRYEVKIVATDTQDKPQQAATAAERLITQDGVHAIVGAHASSATLAALPVVRRYGVPLVNASSWADEVTSLGVPSVFRVGPWNSRVADELARWITEAKITSIGILAEDTDYGLGFISAFKDAAGTQSYKGSIVTQSFEANATDVTPQLIRLRDANPRPQVVFVSSVLPARALAIVQAREVGLTPQTEIVAGWNFPEQKNFWDLVKVAGRGIKYANFSCPKVEPTTVGAEFNKLWESRTAFGPDQRVYMWWDSMLAIAHAAEQAKSVKPEALVAALAAIDVPGTVSRVKFESGRGVRFHQRTEIPVCVLKLENVGDTADKAVQVWP